MGEKRGRERRKTYLPGVKPPASAQDAGKNGVKPGVMSRTKQSTQALPSRGKIRLMVEGRLTKKKTGNKNNVTKKCRILGGRRNKRRGASGKKKKKGVERLFAITVTRWGGCGESTMIQKKEKEKE